MLAEGRTLDGRVSNGGLALGRTIAGWALANDVHGHEPFLLK
jgi:hypothetical protein